MKENVKGRSRLLVKNSLMVGFALSLSSCAMLQKEPELANNDDTAPASVRSVNVQSNIENTAAQISIPELQTTLLNDNQELIDAINNDGQRPTIGDYRENVPSPLEAPQQDIVELNYEQADLRIVLEELFDALDLTIIMDANIDDKISIRTSENRPLQFEDIWPLIRMLTRNAGVSVEKIGNVYQLKKQVSNIPVEISSPDSLDTTTASQVMQITPLTYVSNEAALEVLEPLVTPNGNIRRLSRHTLAISASVDQLRRINQILELVDSDPFANQGIHLFQLYNASAAEVATELAEILRLIEGDSSAYQIRGLERINAILVTSPAARGFDEIERWVTILDADSQESVEQIFPYRVRNLDAVELAATLTDVFEQRDEEEPVGQSTDAQEAAVQLPLFAPIPASTTDAGQTFADVLTVLPSSANRSSNLAVSANLSVTIVADEATNSLLIRSTARDYRQLLNTINDLDTVPLQVMITAVIAQITLTNETRFGVDWSRVSKSIIPAGIELEFTETIIGNVDGFGNSGLLFTKAFLDGSARVEATLNAIAINNDVRLLARPSLTITNNQEGEIKIGSAVPIQQGETIGVGGTSTTNIQYRDVGILLNITPQINDDGVINLTISQTLSSIGGTGVGGNPIFNNQEITTTVVVRDSQNVVLGGLIQTEHSDLNIGVPGLNRIPILGKLFSQQQDLETRTELFIVLRPEIIDLNDYDDSQYVEIRERFTDMTELLRDAGF